MAEIMIREMVQVPLPEPFPTLSWKLSDMELVDKMLGAKDGVILLKDLNIHIPIVGSREVFCKIYAEPEFVATHLRPLSTTREIYKNKAFMDRSIDQKIILDLSPSQIDKLQEKQEEVGDGFSKVMDFHNTLQEKIIPRLITLASCVIAGGGISDKGLSPNARKIRSVHYGMNHKLRLVDYFPVHGLYDRCGEHRDMTTFTLIFQDGREGGLEILREDGWTPVPAESKVVLLWGWPTFILSNGRVPAPVYRVVSTKIDGQGKAPRRNEIVLFVSPDLDAFLFPILTPPDDVIAFNLKFIKDLTMREFKDRFKLKWHVREGSTTEEERDVLEVRQAIEPFRLQQSQDEEIIDCLFSTT